MTPVSDNPAARLTAVLALLKAQPAKSTAGQAWATVLNTVPTDTFTIIAALAKVMDLSARTQYALADAGAASSLTLGWVAPVQTALSQSASLERPLRLVVHHIDNATMFSLQAAELALASIPTSIIQASNIENAISLTDELLSTLNQAGLDPSAHDLMVRHVLALQQALKLYPVVGASGLYDAMMSALAALHLTGTREAEPAAWRQRFSGWMSAIAETLKLGHSIANDVSDVVNALPPGTNPFG